MMANACASVNDVLGDEPAAPVAPAAPSAPSAPAAPVEPAAPSAPAEPDAPVTPYSPCGPVAPVGPCGPVAPCGPTGPCGPGAPVEPWNETPAAPAGPVAPVGPAGPCGPVGPGKPLLIAVTAPALLTVMVGLVYVPGVTRAMNFLAPNGRSVRLPAVFGKDPTSAVAQRLGRGAVVLLDRPHAALFRPVAHVHDLADPRTIAHDLVAA